LFQNSEESFMRIGIGIVALALTLGGCQYVEYPLPGPDAGNPSRMPYAGGPGSLYDSAANPPSNIGRASYDAYSPLTNLPADEALPPPSAPLAVTAAPLPPMANPPARGR
jgi:hypothetical protein